ncbi:hypothetical protein SDC9_74830 [bioreactor metagenome]|uniref:Uncharacterized protein n=1 Tax=bioreactor metagenome TaxID=1076179 RepID=A0A644YIZ6_9ZZZZ
MVPTSFQYPLNGYAINLLPLFNILGIISFPKSLLEFLSFSSSLKNFFKILQLNIYIPIDALVLLGTLGFSSNSYIELSALVFIIPNLLASSIGTSITAIVASALFSL